MGAFPLLPIPMIPSRPVVPVIRPVASRKPEPVRPSERMTLPETDLEMEIGAY